MNRSDKHGKDYSAPGLTGQLPQNSPPWAGAQESTLIYEGDCRFWVMAKEGIERAGGVRGQAQVRFLPYRSEEAERRLGNQYVPGRPEVAFLVGQDGRIQKGLEAFLPLLPGLKGGRILHRLIGVSWLKPLAYLLYRIIARYRYQLFGSVR